MKFLSELGNNKYHSTFDLIKSSEPYDIRRNSLTGDEIYTMFNNRFIRLRDLLLPLKDKIGDIEIVGIDFYQGSHDEHNIIIKYKKNNALHYLSLINFELDQIEVNSSDKEVENEDFIQDNKKILLNIFKRIDDFSFDEKYILHSTSKKFTIDSIGDSFTISDNKNRIFSLTKNYISRRINNLKCNYPKLKEMLEKEEIVLKIFQHIRVYEEDILKVFSKDLYNR